MGLINAFIAFLLDIIMLPFLYFALQKIENYGYISFLLGMNFGLPTSLLFNASKFIFLLYLAQYVGADSVFPKSYLWPLFILDASAVLCREETCGNGQEGLFRVVNSRILGKLAGERSAV